MWIKIKDSLYNLNHFREIYKGHYTIREKEHYCICLDASKETFNNMEERDLEFEKIEKTIKDLTK